MGLKKYEIITVGSDKRVRALRSWAVGGRYVNIGDVGGIVYDEKTLSQDGLCWLFRGNFGFPGARIGGDSIVDVDETGLSSTGAPNVDILGASVVVGSKLLFEAEKTTEDAVVLTVADFEPGTLNFAAGSNWETWKTQSTQNIRSIAPIFMGGARVTLKVDVPGYTVQAFVMDRDGNGIAATNPVSTGAGVTLSVLGGQYFTLRLAKNPAAGIVPADAAAAQITFTGVYETSLSIIDSRVEINQATSARALYLKPGGTYTIASGVKYPEAVIRNSKVSVNIPAAAIRFVRLMGQIIGSTAVLDATASDVTVAGIYSNVKSLQASGVLTAKTDASAYDIIQATDCDNFAVSTAIFPGMAAAQTSNMPFIFQGCNVPDGRFYHHAQIANNYRNIDFAKASVDLGKATANAGITLVSSEVGGMYRLYANGFGALVESHDSVKSLNIESAKLPASYGTTIYKDAYLNGLFDIAGTNVFGNKVRSHPLEQVLNIQPRAVQGIFNTITVGGTITGVVAHASRVCVPIPFRVNGSKGLTINCPTGIEGTIICTDINGVIKGLVAPATGESSVLAAQLINTNAYLFFGKVGGGAITPADLAGVTVTVYNGCKIVNTGATAVNMKGNIRVEDNATLINVSVVGSGYFGGNSIVYRGLSNVGFYGTVHMKDNAVFAPKNLTSVNALVHMEGNAKFTGSVDVASTNLSFIMRDNAVIEGKVNTSSGVVMSGNSKVTAAGQIMEVSRGVLIMEDNASIEVPTTFVGDITLSGNYKGNVVKTWVGKRTITDVNAPEYDNNVKTQYDF